MSEPRGLGVGPDTIRRWQDRGLIALLDTPVRTVLPNLDAGQPAGALHVRLFPPLVERWLPAITVEPVEDPWVD
jgi:hypothetical protein